MSNNFEKSSTQKPPESNRERLKYQFEHPDKIDLYKGGVMDIIDVKPERPKTEVPTFLLRGWGTIPEIYRNNIIYLAERGRKILAVDAPHGIDSAQEIELEVSDFDKCTELFQNIKLKPVRQIEKYRHTFELGDVIIDIDTWPKIPVYAEIEGVSVESLKNICGKLGLDWDKRFDGYALEVFSHYGHNMDNLSIITFGEFK